MYTCIYAHTHIYAYMYVYIDMSVLCLIELRKIFYSGIINTKKF